MSKTKRYPKPNMVALIWTCPKCGEPIEIAFTKKEIKAILKGFKHQDKATMEKVVEQALKRVRGEE